MVRLPGDICVPGSQVRLHVITERLAVFVVAPFLAYLATRRELPSWARAGAAAVAAGTLIVDGHLLTRWAAHR